MTKQVLADHYTNKLEALFLDHDATATEFVNSFESFTRKIEKFEGQTWSEDKKIREFKRRIIRDDYEIEKRNSNVTTLIDFISLLKKREQDLEMEATTKTQHRYKRMDDSESRNGKTNESRGNTREGTSSDSTSGKNKVPFIPNILFRSLDEAGKKNVKR